MKQLDSLHVMSLRTTPKRVWFRSNRLDRNVVILGELGMSTAFISRETGFTESQVIYRLAKAQIRRRDYRNGNSDIASLIVEKVVRSSSDEKMVHDIEDRVKKGLVRKGLI